MRVTTRTILFGFIFSACLGLPAGYWAYDGVSRMAFSTADIAQNKAPAQAAVLKLQGSLLGLEVLAQQLLNSPGNVDGIEEQSKTLLLEINKALKGLAEVLRADIGESTSTSDFGGRIDQISKEIDGLAETMALLFSLQREMNKYISDIIAKEPRPAHELLAQAKSDYFDWQKSVTSTLTMDLPFAGNLDENKDIILLLAADLIDLSEADKKQLSLLRDSEKKLLELGLSLRDATEETTKKKLGIKFASHFFKHEKVLAGTTKLLKEGFSVLSDKLRGTVVDGGKKREVIQEAMQEFVGMIGGLLDKATVKAERDAGSIKQFIIIVSLAAFLVALGSGIFVATKLKATITQVVGSVSREAEATSLSAQSFSQLSQSLSAGASEQAAALEQSNGALQEASSLSQANLLSSKRALEVAHQATEAADFGNSAMGDMLKQMTAILNSSNEISKIINTIEAIALQTNLLALNAAVESARAGEHGRSFAVVAEEVRKLAQQASEAARDTAKLIADSQEQVKSGNESAKRTERGLGTIVDFISQLRELLSEVSTSSDKQNSHFSELLKTVESINQVTQANAHVADNLASSCDALKQHSRSVTTAIGDLRALTPH